MISPLITSPLDNILGWLILIASSLVVAFYIGLDLGKKLKGRYLATFSLIYFTLALTVYFIQSILPSSDPFRNLMVWLLHPIILSNMALDIAFIIGHFRKRYAPTHLLLIALIMIVSISISYFSLPLLSAEGTYEKAIVRNTDNIEEANALIIAENSNYSDIFNLQRFTLGNHNETWPYTWANFIDNQVVEYYGYRFENLKGKPRIIEFNYTANVSTWDQIQVVYVPAPNGETNLDADAIQVLSINGSVLFENAQYTGAGWGMLFAYRNDSEYQRLKAEEINFSLSKGYVIEMTLVYVETWAPLAAFVSKVYQIIILDQNFVPFLLCVQSDKLIS